MSETQAPQFERTTSNGPWEVLYGYCRGVKAGNLIFVAGCAPVEKDGTTTTPGDAYRQAKRCLEIIDQALHDFGASLANVVRTVVYVTDISILHKVGQAHLEAFGPDRRPASTMVEVSKLIRDDMLVEIQVDAVIL